MYMKLTEQQKREFIEAYLKYRADGRTKIRDAYRAARLEMAAANKPAPGFSTFELWLRQGRKAAEAPREEVPEVPEETAAEEAAEEETSDVSDLSDGSDEGREDQEGASSEEEPAEDYTSRLEMMVRLYRRRSERDVDAVCDRLLPELLAEE